MHSNRASLTAAVLLLTTGMLSGCGAVKQLGGEKGGWAAEDQAAVSSAMSTDVSMVEDGVFESEAETAAALRAGNSATEGTAELIHPLKFWRRIAHVERRYEFAFADTDSTGRPTAALVTIHKQLTGYFNVLAGDSMRTDSAAAPVVVHKPLADEWVRKILVKRVPRPDSEMTDSHERWAWKIMASSAVKVSSNLPEVPATHIVSIRIQAGDRDTTLDNPLELMWRHRIPMLAPGTLVTVTVTTERPDDVVALMHQDGRRFMHANGDNTYTGSWYVPTGTGLRHLGINALARGTVFDDRAPYSSEAWLWMVGLRDGGTSVGLH